MSKLLKGTFLVHAIVAGVLGAFLLAIPGHAMTWVGWAPIEGFMSRMVGAGLLGLAWGSLRGWRAGRWEQVAILVEVDLLFTVLACAGLLRELLRARCPWAVWAAFGILAAFAILWLVSLLREARAQR